MYRPLFDDLPLRRSVKTPVRSTMTETRSRLGDDPRSTTDDEISAGLEALREPVFCHKFSLLLQAALPLGRRLRRRLGRAEGACRLPVEDRG